MPDLSIDSLLLILALIVPGYVVDRARSLFLNRSRRDGTSAWLHFLALGALNFAMLSPWIRYLLTTDSLSPLIQIFSWSVILFAFPALLGSGWGKLAQSRWGDRVLRSLNLHVTSPHPSAWDHVFIGTRDSHFVIARLNNGSVIHGLFGENSSAGSSPMSHDIFLEKVYDFDKEAGWTESKDPRSIWIDYSVLQSIEFIPMQSAKEDNDGDGKA